MKGVGAAARDTWFRMQVQGSIDDPRPSVEDAEAKREFAAKRRRGEEGSRLHSLIWRPMALADRDDVMVYIALHNLVAAIDLDLEFEAEAESARMKMRQKLY